MHIIVDGYNLIRRSDVLRDFERRSLEEGRHALLRQLAAYRKIRGHRITVVFDGWRGGSPTEEKDRLGGVEIIYSRLGEKADEVIKRLLSAGNEELLVVTSDREIIHFASRRGKTAIASDDFGSLLERGAFGSRTEGRPDGEDADEKRTGMKKKGPSRRLSKHQKAALARFKKL